MPPRKNDRLPDAFEAISSSDNPNRISREGQELPIDVVKYLRFTNVPPAIAERTFSSWDLKDRLDQTSGRHIGYETNTLYLLLHREWEEGPQFLAHRYDKQHLNEGRETNLVGSTLAFELILAGKATEVVKEFEKVIEKMPAIFQREITGA
ncbi:hypothetical protein N7530_006301 [Penicillium desertorum]|uniref:Uncharacterized protein n=1 Tax=Penicillium desertorum TaxID=1303715 RepID=A0A9W9WRE3_9EURO|nr:hypothetical protein N7530_006301 [Penicillium desertorum]